MAVGLSLPPYVIPEDWSGLEYDIVKEALAVEGHTMTPRQMPLARITKELQAGLVDAAMPMRSDSGIIAYYSDIHVTYRNYAITLASRNLHIASIGDLADKSVLAFQNAKLYLGDDYATMTSANPRYREEARQSLQPLLLYLGRIDVAVADRFIFAWYATAPEVTTKADTHQALRFHAIFPPTDYHVAFRNPALRDSFNRGLQRLRDNGEYARIVQRYSRYLMEEDALRR